MFKRQLEKELHQLLGEYPCVTLLGPRQAGKTTVAQTLHGYDYVNLELPDQRQFAESDPKAFLAQYQGKVILDEIQRVPSLLSYIQAAVDREKRNGQFVMTGSHQLELRAAIGQSLAGRTALLHLYPFSIAELADAGITLSSAADYIYQGFLPRIYDQNQRPTPAYANYYQTYVERDVRQLINLKDQNLFENFIKLLAGRVGQLMDHRSLANDVGVSATTIKHWLSVLEASYVVFKLPPYFSNFGKRVVKSPKYYFVDPGLLAYLLGIETAQQVVRDPLIGQMFENLIISECLKTQANQGKRPELYFFRDSNGNEIDVLVPQGRDLVAIEIKSASTYHPSLLKNLKKFAMLSNQLTHGYLAYSGDRMAFSDAITALRYNQVASIFS